MFRRTLVLLYGVVCYALSMVTFVYAVGFIGGFVTPTRLDGEPTGSTWAALAVNLLLLLAFALQHSGMARPAFKQWLTQYLPEAMERPTYVLLSSVALLSLFWLWRPLGGVIWQFEGIARIVAYSLFVMGWLMVLATTFLINHFDLFGLRQAWLYFRNKPYTPLQFTMPGPYRWVRHPLYLGWFTVFWATPTMTVAHLLFALMTTAYILIAITWEERDLLSAHPEYREYRERVPMLVPRRPRLLSYQKRTLTMSDRREHDSIRM